MVDVLTESPSLEPRVPPGETVLPFASKGVVPPRKRRRARARPLRALDLLADLLLGVMDMLVRTRVGCERCRRQDRHGRESHATDGQPKSGD